MTEVRSAFVRRSFLLGVAGALACAHGEGSASGQAGPRPSARHARLLEWDLGPQSWGRARATVVVPRWGGPEARFPVLVALHGRGEALKSPAEGALGWPRDYALMRAVDRVCAPPLTAADYEGLVDAPRLNRANVELASRPFGGLIIVCPWLPDVHPAGTSDIAAYAHYVIETLLPRARSETPAIAAPEATGIDGVSLGGIVALRIGLTCPDAFGAVGGIQPAIGDEQAAEWVSLARGARARRPDMKLRLLTSEEDYFRDPIEALSRSWNTAGIVHDFSEFPGPHDYVFNRGPGSLGLLLWHDRNLQHG